MNLANILTRKDPLKKAFVALEDDMTDALNEEFMHLNEAEPEAEPEAPEAPEAQGDDESGVEFDTESESGNEAGHVAAEASAPVAESAERLTSHAQNRLAGLAAFDEARSDMQQDLSQLGSALANIVASQHQTREFLDNCYADIRRANDLEILNASYAAENRKLGDRVEKLEKLRARYDQLIEVLKRRETKLLAEAEDLHESLGLIKLEAVEAKNAIARAEFLQGELHTSLAAKSTEAERHVRENELLREKNVNLALDLDRALQRQAETRRKYEDLSAIHANESALIAKTAAKLASEEKEAARLQKLNDAFESRLVEANESIANFTREMKEREELFQSENHALKGEIQTLVSRLHVAAAEQAETAAELTALKTRLNELESEKQFAERKYAGLAAEVESERSQNAGRDDWPQDEGQISALRQQIDELTETVTRLKNEKMAAAKARAKAEGDFPDTFGATVKARPAFRAKLATSRSA